MDNLIVRSVQSEQDIDICVDYCLQSYEGHEEHIEEPSEERIKETFTDSLGFILYDEEAPQHRLGCIFIDTGFTPWYTDKEGLGIVFMYLVPEARSLTNARLLLKVVKDLAETNSKKVYASSGIVGGVQKLGKLLERNDFKLTEEIYSYG